MSTEAAVRTVTISFPPPMPAAEVLADEPQFYNRARRYRMVTPDSELAFEDTRRMHTIAVADRTDRKQRWVPAFATNDVAFRAVIRKAAEKYIQLGAIPSDLPIDQLVAACNWRTRGWELRARWMTNPQKRAEVLQHVGCCRRAGSFIGVCLYVAYQSWRVCEASNTIADLTGYLTPVGTRQIVHRLARTARDMGFETRASRSRRKVAHRKQPRGVNKGFRFLTGETAVATAWRYFVGGAVKAIPLPEKLTEDDLRDCIAWRREGWELRSRWAEGRQLAVAQNRVEAAERLLGRLDEEKAA